MENKIDSIILSQKGFFNRGVTLPYHFRKEALLKLRKVILENSELILNALQLDLGKSQQEAYLTEVGMVLQSISYQLSHLKSLMKPRKVGFSLPVFPSKGKIFPEPYGTVLVISSWNYPFLLSLDPLIGAIAAGNCAVVKPSEYSPATSSVLEKIISEIYSPEYIAVMCGGVELSKALLERKFDYIFYTGSTTVGRIVMKKAAEHLTPVTLELGGKSPCIIAPDANIREAVRRVIFGKSINSGQTCVAPDYLIVHKDVAEAVTEEFLRQLSPLPPFFKIVNKAHFQRLSRYLQQGKIMLGGGLSEESLQMQFTLLSPGEEDDILKEEIFGPILPVLTYCDEHKLLDELKLKEKPLACYVFSRNKAFVSEIMREFSFGSGAVNDTLMHMAHKNLPFGGVGNSGMGAYHGKASFDTFTHYKSVLISPSRWVFPLRYPPYTGLKEKIIKLFLQ